MQDKLLWTKNRDLNLNLPHFMLVLHAQYAYWWQTNAHFPKWKSWNSDFNNPISWKLSKHFIVLWHEKELETSGAPEKIEKKCMECRLAQVPDYEKIHFIFWRKEVSKPHLPESSFIYPLSQLTTSRSKVWLCFWCGFVFSKG